MKRGPSEEELVHGVMQQWIDAWARFDADLMASLASESYYGANGESKEQLLEFVRKCKEDPENQATFSLTGAVIQVQGDRASVRGVQADVNIQQEDVVGQFKLDYFLQKEEGMWKITGGALAG